MTIFPEATIKVYTCCFKGVSNDTPDIPPAYGPGVGRKWEVGGQGVCFRYRLISLTHNRIWEDIVSSVISVLNVLLALAGLG